MHRAMVYRSHGRDRLWVRMPYASGNRAWIHEICGSRTRPEWEAQPTSAWRIARPHFRRVVDALVERFGEVDVYVDISARDRCDTRCRDAEGDDCSCSCLGDNHGGAAYWKNWIEVGETTLVEREPHVHRRHWIAR